jgi:hypothetical protein
MKIRIFLAVLIAAVLAVPFYSAYSADFEFKDVNEEHENFDAIRFLSEAGVIDGYLDEETGERSYKPENEINRAEFLKILLKDSGYQADLSSKCFPDVEVDVWYAPYVCAAKKLGLVNGYEDGKFKPETMISEAEALKIVGKAFEWQVEGLEAGEEWYEPYLNYAKNAELIKSEDVSAFLNRGGMAELVFRSLVVIYFGAETFDEGFIDDLFAVLEDNGNVVDDTVDVGEDEDDEVDNSTDDDDVVSDVGELKIYIPSSSPAGEKFDIEIEAYCPEGGLLSGRELSAVVTTGIDFYEELSVSEGETGHYKTSFESVLAGEYNLIVTDVSSGVESETSFAITPLSLSSVEIIDTVSPPVNGEVDKGYIKVVGRDEFGNILPYSSSNNLSAVTSLGAVANVSHDEYGVFTMEVTADKLGTASVSVINKADNSVFSESADIQFLSVQLDPPKGIDMNNTSQIDIPVYIYFPEELGDLYSYNLTLIHCPKTLAFSSVEDPDPSDGFDLPSVEVDKENGIIYLSQTVKEGAVSSREVAVANLKMDVIGVGTGAIYVGDGALTNTQEEQGFLSSVLDGVVKWWYNIKDTKDVCIDVFTAPGSNATQGKVNQDIAWANLIFSKIAGSCNCDYYLNFSIHSFNVLDAAQWGAVDANGDGDLDENELTNMRTTHPPSGTCIPVYYPPMIHGGDLGWAWRGADKGVAMDNNRDRDHRTLAHEIAHYLSDNEVRDPGNPPESTSQGADTAGNLMNYNNTGDVLTEDQCELIEKYLP